MAFADDMSFNDNAAAAKTFSRQSLDAQRCSWIDTGSTASEPRVLRISHRREAQKANPGETQDRHTIEFYVVKKDPTTGRLYQQTVSVGVQYPLTGPLVRADLDHLLSFFRNATNGFLTTTQYVDKLLRSEL